MQATVYLDGGDWSESTTCSGVHLGDVIKRVVRHYQGVEQAEATIRVEGNVRASIYFHGQGRVTCEVLTRLEYDPALCYAKQVWEEYQVQQFASA